MRQGLLSVLRGKVWAAREGTDGPQGSRVVECGKGAVCLAPRVAAGISRVIPEANPRSAVQSAGRRSVGAGRVKGPGETPLGCRPHLGGFELLTSGSGDEVGAYYDRLNTRATKHRQRCAVSARFWVGLARKSSLLRWGLCFSVNATHIHFHARPSSSHTRHPK